MTPRKHGPYIDERRRGRRQMPRETTDLGIEKQCRYCLDFWPLDQFRKHTACRDGRSDECKACRSERRAA